MAGNNTLKKLLFIGGGGLVPGAIIGFRFQYYKRVEEKEVCKNCDCSPDGIVSALISRRCCNHLLRKIAGVRRLSCVASFCILLWVKVEAGTLLLNISPKPYFTLFFPFLYSARAGNR